MRLIFHLSYPRTKKGEVSTSVNANTPEHLCKVQYPDFNDAVLRCLQEGKSCKIAKLDNHSAFRNLGILKSHWRYLIMKAKSPIDGQWYYFIDKCLPFGASISCAHYQAVSDAVAFLVEFRTGKVVINYLDDYLFAQYLRNLCNNQVVVFLAVCKDIGLPVAEDKTFWACELMTFLGFLLDTINQVIGIPRDKISKGLNMINSILQLQSKSRKKRKATVLQLQQLTGFLNFLSRAIIPGRAFNRRMYAKFSGNKNLRQHHHVRLDDELFLDLEMWKEFLLHPSIFSRSFLDLTNTYDSVALQFYSDASRNFSLGFGSYCYNEWMQGRWKEVGIVDSMNPSIQYLELFALCAAVLQWISKFENKHISIYCDNETVVTIINNSTSACKNCMVLVRIIVLHCLIHNVKLTAKFVRSKDNGIADSLSRFQMDHFHALTKNRNMNELPTAIPALMKNVHKLGQWDY